MKGRTHLAFGVLIAILFYQIFGSALSVLIVILLSLLPDIDHPHSKLGKKVPIISHLIRFTAGHRGIMHSLIPPVFIAAIVYLAGFQIYAMAVLAGYISHLALDSLTHSGVGWFYPVPVRIKGIFATGGLFDFILFIFFAGSSAFLLYSTL